jgi:hypothetical protein
MRPNLPNSTVKAAICVIPAKPPIEMMSPRLRSPQLSATLNRPANSSDDGLILSSRERDLFGLFNAAVC